MRVLGIIFYTTILIVIGLLGITFAFMLSFNNLQPLCVKFLSEMLTYVQNNFSARITIVLSGFLLIVISYSFAQLILDRFQREKTIAFKTASGEVTIALSAIEDLIRRIARILPEVQELRPNVRADKKGTIMVDLRVVLRSESNIPSLTDRLEEITKTKIQEVVGLEEKILVNTHIVKIIALEEKKKKDQEKDEPAIPFGGYGRSI